MNSGMITLLMAFAAAGCSAIPTSTVQIPLESAKPVPTERVFQRELTIPGPGRTARISFLRDAGMVGGACAHKILLDGHVIFHIRGGESQTLYLEPGRYSFGLEVESDKGKFGGLTIKGTICPTFSTSGQTLLVDGAEETYRIFFADITSPPQIALIDRKSGTTLGSWGGLQGRVENGWYVAPNDKVMFHTPRMSSAWSSSGITDSYVSGIDRGFLVDANLSGIKGLYYARLTSMGISTPSDDNEHRAALNKGWTDFAMPYIFTAASRNAEVVHQELIVDQGKEMLLALVRLPELSGRIDQERKKKFDTYPAVLLTIEGGYVVVLRIQSYLDDTEGKDPKDRIAAGLSLLQGLKAGLQVRP